MSIRMSNRKPRRQNIMRTLLVLGCCFGLASFVSAAQPPPDYSTSPAPKKKGQTPVQATQPVATPKAKTSGHAMEKKKFQTQQNMTAQPAKTGSPSSYRSHPAAQTGKEKTGKEKTATTFKGKHFDLANKPKPNIPKAEFKAGARIPGSEKWQGPKYAVYRNYKAEWHDQGWWRSHYTTIIFVFGAPYYWFGSYWYPAWGYDPYATYYYDGPIYASSPDVYPDQMVANVQAALQEQGYYTGEVD